MDQRLVRQNAHNTIWNAETRCTVQCTQRALSNGNITNNSHKPDTHKNLHDTIVRCNSGNCNLDYCFAKYTAEMVENECMSLSVLCYYRLLLVLLLLPVLFVRYHYLPYNKHTHPQPHTCIRTLAIVHRNTHWYERVQSNSKLIVLLLGHLRLPHSCWGRNKRLRHANKTIVHVKHSGNKTTTRRIKRKNLFANAIAITTQYLVRQTASSFSCWMWIGSWCLFEIGGTMLAKQCSLNYTYSRTHHYIDPKWSIAKTIERTVELNRRPWFLLSVIFSQLHIESKLCNIFKLLNPYYKHEIL